MMLLVVNVALAPEPVLYAALNVVLAMVVTRNEALPAVAPPFFDPRSSPIAFVSEAAITAPPVAVRAM
jgi:hypothetical protein